MIIIMMGAPGCGKGTQAELIIKKHNIPSVSTGNMLREAIKNQSEIGIKAKSYLDSGKLVPDDVIVEIVKNRLAQPDCANGCILDGFPRTITQAEALDKMGVNVDIVISIEVADSEIENRMSGRRVCSGCGASYHISVNPPSREGVCNTCGGDVVQREDDKPETVRARITVYHNETEPVKGFYQRKGILKSVVSEGGIESVSERISQAMEAVND